MSSKLNKDTTKANNDLLKKMNTLLSALNEHVDAHPNSACCLKNVLKLIGDKETI